MVESKGQEAVRRFEELRKVKARWHDMWQLVGEFIHQMKQDFTQPSQPGEMLNENVFDSTAIDANTKATAALIGMLWPSSKAVLLQPPKTLRQTAKTKAYFEKINERVRAAFDDPKAGFTQVLEEYIGDQLSLGTSGIACFPGDESLLSFECWGVDECAIAQDHSGRTNEIYRHVCWPLRNVVAKYGAENLSRELQEAARHPSRLDEKVEIIQRITLRQNFVHGMRDNKNMKIESLHVEYKSKHTILESGYPELPVAIGLFYKRRNESYGRSPGMKALPDILELQVTKESRMLAIEKALDPPFAIYNDAMMGNSKFKTTARAVNVIKQSGRMKGGGNPIIPLFDGSNIREADKSVEELKQSINNHYMLDRLLDFNNTTQMTLGEAQMRQQLRGESLGSIYTRQNAVLTQVVERGVAVLFRAGELGLIEGSIEHRMAMAAGEEALVIPDEIAKLITAGKDFYEIKYQSPATRIMEAQEAQGVLRAWEFAGANIQVDPEMVDGLDGDESLNVIARAFGAPSAIQVAKEKIDKIRAERAKLMEQRMAQEQAAMAAQTAAAASQVKPAA